MLLPGEALHYHTCLTQCDFKAGRLLWGAINILSHSEQCCPNVLDGVRSSDSHVGSREEDAITRNWYTQLLGEENWAESGCKQKGNSGKQGLNYLTRQQKTDPTLPGMVVHAFIPSTQEKEAEAVR